MTWRFFSVALAISLILVGCGNTGRTLAQSGAPAPAATSPAPPAQTAAQAAPTRSAASTLTEAQKIEKLLAAIETSRAIFIRNGTEHESAEAVKHLRTKLKSAGSKVKTAREFIDTLASQSSMSGKPYEIKLPDGTKTPSRDWLLAELARIETADQVNAKAAATSSRTANRTAAAGGKDGSTGDADAITYEKVLGVVRASKLTFQRGDVDAAAPLSGPEMARHIMVKFVLSGAPAIPAPEFIERYCTKATRHGTAYTAVLEDGSQVPLADWLREQTKPGAAGVAEAPLAIAAAPDAG